VWAGWLGNLRTDCGVPSGPGPARHHVVSALLPGANLADSTAQVDRFSARKIGSAGLVWALSKPEELSAKARRALATSGFTASVANLWELVLKARKPGSLLADPLPWWNEYVTQSRIPALAIRIAHIRALAAFPTSTKIPSIGSWRPRRSPKTSPL
jgi:hypothetical protein